MVKHTTATNMQKKTNLKSLSRFLQILDGTFPSGVFVHSFGLEPHIIKENVKDAEVEITFDPPWSKDLMSEEAKLELGML